MSSCEKCWADSRTGGDYMRLLKERESNPCTPEEQAGPDAGQCPVCKRMTMHQYTGEAMCGCTQPDQP
jgi:hypothetical protein